MSNPKYKKVATESDKKIDPSVPQKLKHKTDDCVMKYQSTSDGIHTYIYTKSITKKGMTVPIRKEELEKMLRNGIVFEIK